MFGYQFLNGCNPVVIEKCTKLPDKLPVTNEMVSVCLERGLTLEEEIQVDLLLIRYDNKELCTSTNAQALKSSQHSKKLKRFVIIIINKKIQIKAGLVGK